MVYPFEHYQIVWGGSLPGGDIWSCSLRYGDSLGFVPEVGPLSLYDGASQINGWVGTAIKDFHARSDSRISAGAKLNFIKSNKITVDGKYKDQDSHTLVFEDIPGASSGTFVPNQVALVVSLTTAMSRGYAHRGRFYLPTPAIPVGADGRIAAAMAQQVGASVKTMIEAMDDVPGIDGAASYEVQVMSKHGSGAANTVTGVEIGRVLDTQRRRRNKLAEDYQGVALDLGIA